MATQVGTAHIFGTPATVGIASLTGYITPNVQTLDLSHNSDIDKIKSQTGEVSGIISSGDSIECEFNFIPEGTTTLNAKLSAGIPASLSGITITGLPIIAFGPFTDAFNTNSGNTQPWIYEGGGKIKGASDGKWTAIFTLHRYIGITSASALS